MFSKIKGFFEWAIVGYSLRKGSEKGIQGVVAALIAYLSSPKAAEIMGKLGVSVDWSKFGGEITVILTGLSLMAINYAKNRITKKA